MTLPGPVRTWRSLADEAGVQFHPELVWTRLLPALGGWEGPRRYWVSAGSLDDPAASALFAVLVNHSGEAKAYFYFDGYSSGGEQLLFRAPPVRFSDVCDLARRTRGAGHEFDTWPEFVWPTDRSWVVNTDTDLVSTYIACDEDVADQILNDTTLESVLVSLDTRVDDNADRLNQRRTAADPAES
jgi:hypothetical protein